MKYKEKIIPIVYALIIFGVLYFSLRPLLAGINDKADRIQEEALDEEARQKKMNGLTQLKADFQKVQEKKEALGVLLPESETVSLIKEIEKIAEETGNEIKIEIEEKTKEKEVTKKAKKEAADSEKKEKDIIDTFPAKNQLKMKISLFGTYNSVAYLVDRIENMRYWSGITAIQIFNHDLRGLDNSSTARSPFVSMGVSDKKSEVVRVKEKMSAIIDVVFFMEENN